MKVLFFRQPVSLMDRDLIQALEKRGMEVFIEDINQAMTPEGHTVEMFSHGRIQEILDSFRPDLVLSFNGSGLDDQGVISREFERRGIPYATWFVDRPRVTDIRDKYVKANSHLFVFDKTYIKTMKDSGFTSVHYLPLATNPDRFRPLDGVAREDQVCFIGELDYKTIQYLARNIDAMADGADENFYQGIEMAIKAQLKRPGEDTWIIIDEILTERGIDTNDFPQVFRDILEGFVEREAGLRMRMETMKSVSAQFPTVVYGESLWESVLGHRYHGRVNYYTDEIVHIYNRYTIHVNISKFQLRTAINQRPFDVPACGGFLITDIRDDILELFASDEVVTFETTDDLLEKIRNFFYDKALRSEYVRKARKRVLAEHTYDHRINEILNKVQGIGSKV